MSEENSQANSENSNTLNKQDKPDAELETNDIVAEAPDDALDDDDNTVDEDTIDALTVEEKRERIHFLKPIVEGAVMAAGEAIKLKRLQSLFDEHEMPSQGLLIEVLEAIQHETEGRGFELKEVASGWRFQVREEYATWVNRLWEEKPQKYSRALLETLALIAYRQPLTRGDIEEVRGVAVSSHIIKTLTERDWVKAVGHRDVPGRPALYATTKAFLDYFNLKSLDELPTLGELRDIESLNASLELEQQLPAEMIAEMKVAELSAETSELVDEGETAHHDMETKDEPLNAGVRVDEDRVNEPDSIDAQDPATTSDDLDQEGRHEVNDAMVGTELAPNVDEPDVATDKTDDKTEFKNASDQGLQEGLEHTEDHQVDDDIDSEDHIHDEQNTRQDSVDDTALVDQENEDHVQRK